MITERNRKQTKNDEINFDVVSIAISSSSEAVLHMQNIDKAIGITKMINFAYNMSLLDGGKQKLNFNVELIMRKNSNPPCLEYKNYSDAKKITESKEENPEVMPTDSVRIRGDLIQAFNFMARTYISETTQKEAVEAVPACKLQEDQEHNRNVSNNM